MPSFNTLFEEAARTDSFWTEELIAEFTEELARWMEDGSVSRTELARKISHDPSYITKVLRGNVNFTFATVAKLARAVGARPRIHLAPAASVKTVYFDVMEGSQTPTATDSLDLPSNVKPATATILQSRSTSATAAATVAWK